MAVNFCVIDLETTGLDTNNDFILEMGAILVDEHLAAIPDIEPFHQVLQYRGDPGVFEDVVIEMHTKSGLWSECADSMVKTWSAIRRFADWCNEYIENKENTYATGNNIKFDVTFLYNNGFAHDSYMHYRTIDISSIKVLANTWLPQFKDSPYKPEAKKLHRSIPDIYDSIMELDYYKGLIFDD